MIINALITLSLLAPVASAQSARLKLRADGRCESYLLASHDHLSTTLNPSAVLIDLVNKRILFSVVPRGDGVLPTLSLSDAKIFCPEPSGSWRDLICAENRKNREAAPKGNVWIDATEDVPLAARLFSTYAWYDADPKNVEEDVCYGAAAKLLGLPAERTECFDERDYFLAGYREIDTPFIDQATMAAIYSIEPSGVIIPQHSFLPILGTNLAIDKMGAGAPLLIHQMDEIYARYQNRSASPRHGFRFRYTVRSFLKPSNRSPLLIPQSDNPRWRREIEAVKTRQMTLIARLREKFGRTEVTGPRPAQLRLADIKRLDAGEATVRFPVLGEFITRRLSLDLRDPQDPILSIELRDAREAWPLTQMIYEAFVLNAYARSATSLNAESGLMPPQQKASGPWIDGFGFTQAEVVHRNGKAELEISATSRLTARLGYSGIPPYFENLLMGLRDYLALDSADHRK